VLDGKKTWDELIKIGLALGSRLDSSKNYIAAIEASSVQTHEADVAIINEVIRKPRLQDVDSSPTRIPREKNFVIPPWNPLDEDEDS
jgi:hypothetical protein